MQPRPLNWDDLRYFLALARHGNLTAAARQLLVSQPTVGRRIDAFEAQLGSRLFVRTPSRWRLSTAGQQILAHAEVMEREILAAEHLARGKDDGMSGLVRLTASEWLLPRVLSPLLARFSLRYPNVVLELVSDTRWLNLAQREADVALRPAPFEHQQIVQREVATLSFGLYASKSYLEQHRPPDFARGCAGQSLLVMQGDCPIADVSWLNRIAGNANVIARCNARETLAGLAVAGAGLACLPRILGDSLPELELLQPPTHPPKRKLRTGVHSDAQRTPRVRALLDFVTEGLRAMQPQFCP